jgi:hypothetical protein
VCGRLVQRRRQPALRGATGAGSSSARTPAPCSRGPALAPPGLLLACTSTTEGSRGLSAGVFDDVGAVELYLGDNRLSSLPSAKWRLRTPHAAQVSASGRQPAAIVAIGRLRTIRAAHTSLSTRQPAAVAASGPLKPPHAARASVSGQQPADVVAGGRLRPLTQLRSLDLYDNLLMCAPLSAAPKAALTTHNGPCATCIDTCPAGQDAQYDACSGSCTACGCGLQVSLGHGSTAHRC